MSSTIYRFYFWFDMTDIILTKILSASLNMSSYGSSNSRHFDRSSRPFGWQTRGLCFAFNITRSFKYQRQDLLRLNGCIYLILWTYCKTFYWRLSGKLKKVLTFTNNIFNLVTCHWPFRVNFSSKKFWNLTLVDFEQSYQNLNPDSVKVKENLC